VIAAGEVLEHALAGGHDLFTGVPCSYLGPLIDAALQHPRARYVGAADEGEAVAVASGAWLAGHGGVVMMQSSGLGNAVNPLATLSAPFRIPSLLVVSWRGKPGEPDEPQHELMGEIVPPLLELLGIPGCPLPGDASELGAAFDEARAGMSLAGLPFAFIAEAHSLRPEAPRPTPAPATRHAGKHLDIHERGTPPARADVLERLLAIVPERAAIIATTGKCGRELAALADRPQHLYQVGSMGCASALGLGVALHAARPVVVLDGDGAALMRMGALATIGAQAPRNLVHVVLDNGVYDSTGGQATASGSVDFAAVALACGYGSGIRCDGLGGFAAAFTEAIAMPGPHLIAVHIRPGSMAGLGRPAVRPDEVARRFRGFLTTP